MEIVKAVLGNHIALTEISRLSKAYWGYSDEQLLLWKAALTITEAYILENYVFKLIEGNEIIGYYSYIKHSENTVLLDNLFIHPEYIGKGYGQILMEDFLNRLKTAGIIKVILEADPNAESFYNKFGFIKTSDKPTEISERYLPVMQLLLK